MSQTVQIPESDTRMRSRPALTSTGPLQGAAAVLLVLQGEWDISGRPALSEILSRLIAQRDTDVIVDLSRVTFVDTAICRAFTESQTLLGRSGHKLTLRSPTKSTASLLRLFGLSNRIDTAPTRLGS